MLKKADRPHVGLLTALGVAMGLAVGCPSSPAPLAEAPAPDAGASVAPEPQTLTPPEPQTLTPLEHRRSPGRAPDPGAPGWVREHPSVTGGLLSALAPWADGVAVGTTDGEVFLANRDNVWRQLGPRRNVEIVALSSHALALFVLDADGALFRSTDGVAFAQIKPPPPGDPGDPRVPGVGRPWRSVASAQRGAAEVVLLAGRGRHVAFSRDGGATWSEEELGGPETLESAFIDAEGTFYVTGERGRSFRRGPKAAAWDELHMNDKPTALWIGRAPGRGGKLLTTDAGGTVRSHDGDEWSVAGAGPGPLRAIAVAGNQLYAACQGGGVVSVALSGPDTKYARVWSGDTRPLTHIVTVGDEVWAAGPELLVRRAGKAWVVLRGDTTQTLEGVAVVGQGRGFAVGRNGLMLARDESPVGAKWSSVALAGPAQDLRDVTFASGRFGWAVGSDGRVGRTDDGGKSWAFTNPGSVSDLRSVTALDPLNVFVGGAGAALLASSDRGESWRRLDLPPMDGRGVGLDLTLERTPTDARLVGASDQGFLVETALGRADVTATDFGFVTPSRVSSAEGVSWLLDLGGAVLRRLPGQSAWQVVAVPQGLAFTGLAFDGHGAGIALMSSGAVFRTADGGARWWMVLAGPARTPAAVASVGPGRFVIVGHGGEIQSSSDGGLTWSPAPTGVGKSLTAVATVGDKTVAVGFRGAALQSADAGATWAPWTDGPGDIGTTHLTALEVDGGRVALGGIGALWVREGAGDWARLSADAAALGEVRRLRWGGDGALLAVTATGALWHRSGAALVPMDVPLPPKAQSVRWFGLAKASGRTLAVTDEGVVEVTLSSEPVWERAQLSQGVGAVPTGVVPSGGRTWLLGSGGLWTYERAEWKQVIAALPTRPTDIHFASASVGYAIGGTGVVYRTDDGGLSWRAEGTPTRTDLIAVDVGADGRAIAVGAGGLILRRVGR